jgi:CAAX prenyl protease-like protein
MQMAARLAEMPVWLATGWIIFRVLGSVLTVPIAEELAFRGYLLRKLVATDFEKVAPGTFSWLSFVVSSVLFGLMHDNWLAGTLAGAGFAAALYQRGQVSDAIAAHITSNALIGLVVLAAGKWELWG